MPGMSGLETTRRIRGLGGPAAAVPIVALTASIMSGGPGRLHRGRDERHAGQAGRAARTAGRHRAACLAAPVRAIRRSLPPRRRPSRPCRRSCRPPGWTSCARHCPPTRWPIWSRSACSICPSASTLLLEAVRQQDDGPDRRPRPCHGGHVGGIRDGHAGGQAARADAGACGRTPDAAGALAEELEADTVPRRRRAARGLPDRNGLSVQAMLTRRRDHACMLSPATLAAFSTGMAQPGFGQTSSVHRVRCGRYPAAAARIADGTSDPSRHPARDGDATPSRLLPRGSLLDLSV